MLDYDPVTMLHSERRRARKEHKCNECFRTIFIGERYLNEGILWGDGDGISTHRVCWHCQVVRQMMMWEEGCYLIGNGALQDWLCEVSDLHWTFRVMNAGICNKWTNKKGKLWRKIYDGKKTWRSVSFT